MAEKFIFIGDRSAEKTWIFLFFFFCTDSFQLMVLLTAMM